MQIEMLKSKIHRATVTQANMDYEGSVTIDRELMIAARIWENQKVHIWNITNGSRIVTYAIPGEPSTGVIGINGAGVHQNSVGDLVIIASYGLYNLDEAKEHKPKVLLIKDTKNMVVAWE